MKSATDDDAALDASVVAVGDCIAAVGVLWIPSQLL
jgi:hypothetical protein